ncbi:uncharacterized protein CPUR_02292 [Claviceps purpurea 20.1]|uniref:Uncharacterized protein n=1 Tax=Claviceps purpurea (strain 20.1) TaxID=1111077 RepID=M1W3M0_CLAP2|nr:uncharacterized protein CPUR_02292 [Claviceps purpurea 20.1]
MAGATGRCLSCQARSDRLSSPNESSKLHMALDEGQLSTRASALT